MVAEQIVTPVWDPASVDLDEKVHCAKRKGHRNFSFDLQSAFSLVDWQRKRDPQNYNWFLFTSRNTAISQKDLSVKNPKNNRHCARGRACVCALVTREFDFDLFFLIQCLRALEQVDRNPDPEDPLRGAEDQTRRCSQARLNPHQTPTRGIYE